MTCYPGDYFASPRYTHIKPHHRDTLGEDEESLKDWYIVTLVSKYAPLFSSSRDEGPGDAIEGPGPD